MCSDHSMQASHGYTTDTDTKFDLDILNVLTSLISYSKHEQRTAEHSFSVAEPHSCDVCSLVS